MHRNVPVLMTATCAILLSFTGASASPPTGRFSWTDHARASAVEQGTVKLPSGTDVFTSVYTLASGADSGWRSLPGTSVLAATKGKMTLHGAEGCTTKQYSGGQAAVVPPGRYLVHNAATEPLEFVGAFLGLSASGPKPLVAEREAAPAECPALAALPGGGMSLLELGRGTIVTSDGYSGHAPGGDTFEQEAGKEIGISYYRIEPGTSFGWHSHHGPPLFVVIRGTAVYYEGHGGKCVESGKFSAGQAFFAIPDEHHNHLAFVDGDETLEIYGVFFNLPRSATSAVPIFGQQLDSSDFSKSPPPDCPHLRDRNL